MIIHANGMPVGEETWSFNIVFTETVRAMLRNPNYSVTVQSGTPEFMRYFKAIPPHSKQRGWSFKCGNPDTLDVMPMQKRSYYCYWGEHHFKKTHVDKMNTLDLVFVNSTFSRRLLQESGATVPIEILRPGVNNALHFPSDRVYGKDKVRFLFVGQQWRRKGLDQLAEVWKEFARNRTMELTIKLSPHNQADFDVVRSLFNGSDNVNIRMEHMFKEDLAELYRANDVFLFPSRSEGFGIPVQEALACGLLPIATNYGGYMDFCTPENALLVPVKGLSQRNDGMDTGEWANIDLEALREAIIRASNMDLNEGKHIRSQTVSAHTYDTEVERIRKLFTL